MSRNRSYISSTSHEFVPKSSPDAAAGGVFVGELTAPAYLLRHPPLSGVVDVGAVGSSICQRAAETAQPSMNSDSSQSTSHRIPLVMSAFLCDSYGHSNLLVGAVPPNLPSAFNCRIAPRTTAMMT